MSAETGAPASPRRRLFVLLPLLVFLGLAGLFLSQLLSGRDESEIPSALIGL
ncbi:MAG: DsbE family thiol:disulfide interchange protein, partial [Mesorhizobium sp.]